MEEEEVVTVLQHYRHDLMNELQVVQGYLTMGKADKVKTKMNELFASFNEERKLMSLNIPKFTLWVIRFNSIYKNFRLTYEIHTEYKSFQHVDRTLLERCKQILEEIKNDPFQLVDVHLCIQEQGTNMMIKIYINGNVDKMMDVKTKLDFNMELIETDHGVLCKFVV